MCVDDYAIKVVLIDDGVVGKDDGIVDFVKSNLTGEIYFEKVSCLDSGLHVISRVKPDYVFVNVDLLNTSVLELIRSLDFLDFKLVLLTVNDQFVIRAIRYSDIKFLVTSKSKAHYNEGMCKFLKQDFPKINEANFTALKENLKNLSCISLNLTDGEKMNVPLDDIIRFQSIGNLVEIFLKDNTSVCIEKSLKELDEILGDRQFCSANDKNLVNLNYVDKYMAGGGGNIYLVDHTKIRVGKKYREDLLEMLMMSS